VTCEESGFFTIRFFAREAQNDNVWVILRNEGSCFFHIKILRKRGSERQLLRSDLLLEVKGENK